MKWVKVLVLRLARAPAQPHVPEGAEESVRVSHAGRNYFVWRLILRGIASTAVALALLAAFIFSFIPRLQPLVRAIWLAYEVRWYIVTDRSLRIRSGVVWLQVSR